MQNALVVDSSAINTLLEASGTSGLDSLLSGGDQVVITQEVIQEVRANPDASKVATFDNWLSNNASILSPDMGYIGQNQGGDNSIRDFAQQNSSTYSSRFLADDTGIYNFEQNTAPGGFDDLAARGQYAPPITAPENFWANAF